MLILGLAQTVVSFHGDSLIPGLGGNRPVMVEQEGEQSERPQRGGSATVRSARKLALLAIVAVLAVGAGIGAWALARERGPLRPEISAYSDGHSTRVGPYRYCSVLDLTDCQSPQSEGELKVNSRAPVQLSVPTSIGQAPWWLLHGVRGFRHSRDDVLPTGQPAGSHHPYRRSSARTADRDRGAVDDGVRRPER